MSNRSDVDSISVPVAILIGSVIIGGSIVFAASRIGSVAQNVQNQPKAVTTTAPTQNAALAPDIKLIKTNSPVLGNTSAPIVVAYWFDYQCPFCKQQEQNVMSQVMKDYVNTGKIRVVYKDLQFLGADSTSIGLFGRAVWEGAPSKYYAWRKAMFENQGRENSGWATEAKITEISAKVMNAEEIARVKALIASKSNVYKAMMDADKTEGSQYGVRSTPSLIVGKQVITGARDYDTVKAAIELALKK